MMRGFGRIRNAVVDALSGPRIVFHHVPKCGGTSVARALRVRYAVSFGGFPTLPTIGAIEAAHPDFDEVERTRIVDQFREYLLLYYLFQDTRCVAGHVRFSNTAYDHFNDKYKFVTTLREPISMMISAYFYEKHLTDNIWNTPSDIEEYIEGPPGERIGAIYSNFFSGLPAGSDPRSPASIKRAKDNLRLFSAVGFVDDMTAFQQQLSNFVGLRLKIGHRNKSVASNADRSSTITQSIRSKINAVSSANIEIYDFAKRELRR